MDSSGTGDGTSCRTMIKVSGKSSSSSSSSAASRAQPVYTVPLQSTATLNIHLSHPNGSAPSASSAADTKHSTSALEFRAPHATSGASSHEAGRSADQNRKQNTSSSSPTSIGASSLSVWHGPEAAADDEGEQCISMNMVDGDDEGTEESPSSNGDSDTEIDVQSLALNAKKNVSTFNYMAWDVATPTDDEDRVHSLVLVMKESDTVLIFKASFERDKIGSDPRLWSLMVNIADNCIKRLIKMKGMTIPKILPQHMDTLPLSDGRATRIHLEEISKVLGGTVMLTDVAYRFQQDGVFIGTYVQGTVNAKRNYAIGKLGVVVVLAKKSKYATTEAFSEQLCEHIAIEQPASLGYVSDADIKRINKRGTMKIVHLQKDQLVLQNFLFDPTIIVAEAARRSFVKIEDFLLFK